MAIAARSGRLPRTMDRGDPLYEEFSALGIRCRSTSLSAPELNCPSMTFSTSSSTTTEPENETPPSSPPESAQATPRLKFAFDDNNNDEESGDGDDFSTRKMQRKAMATYASRNSHGRLAFEIEREECDGYEAGCEGGGIRERKAPMPVIGSPRESTKLGEKKARGRVKKAKQQSESESQISACSNTTSTTSLVNAPTNPRQPMRYRNRKPSGLSIMVPVENANTAKKGSPETKGTNARRPSGRANVVRENDARSSSVTNRVSSSSTSTSALARHGSFRGPQTVKLCPHICDDEPSPIEALPSPIIHYGVIVEGGSIPGPRLRADRSGNLLNGLAIQQQI